MISLSLSKSWSLISSSTYLQQKYILFANIVVLYVYWSELPYHYLRDNAKVLKYTPFFLPKAECSFGLYLRFEMIEGFVDFERLHFAWSVQNIFLKISIHSIVFGVLRITFCYWWWAFVFRFYCTWLNIDRCTSVLFLYFGELHGHAVIVFMVLQYGLIIWVFPTHDLLHPIEEHDVALFNFCLFVLL